MTEGTYRFGAGFEAQERERRFAELIVRSLPQQGKLSAKFSLRFESSDSPGPIGTELPLRMRDQTADIGAELASALDALERDWWSVQMLLQPIIEDLDGVLANSRNLRDLVSGVAEALDSFVSALELRRFERGKPASPDCWAPEGIERLGTTLIRSWKLRCSNWNGPGDGLRALEALSAAVDSIASWLADGKHGIDELPKSAAPSVAMASASPHSETAVVVDPTEDGAADPALKHVEDGQEFEAALAEHAPTNGARERPALIRPPESVEVEHILRRKPRTLAKQGVK